MKTQEAFPYGTPAAAEPRRPPQPRKVRPPRDELAALRAQRRRDDEALAHSFQPWEAARLWELVRANLGPVTMVFIPRADALLLWRGALRCSWVDSTRREEARKLRLLAALVRGGLPVGVEAARAPMTGEELARAIVGWQTLRLLLDEDRRLHPGEQVQADRLFRLTYCDDRSLAGPEVA